MPFLEISVELAVLGSTKQAPQMLCRFQMVSHTRLHSYLLAPKLLSCIFLSYSKDSEKSFLPFPLSLLQHLNPSPHYAVGEPLQ